MDDLISRQAAIDAIEAEKQKRGDYLTSSCVGYEVSENVIKALPSAQPEIIRCKDCKHRLSSLYCEAWNNSPGFPCVPDDGYCWMHDERRTDDDRNG